MASPELVDKEQNANGTVATTPARNAVWTYLSGNVDPAQCTAPLSAFCFMTGFIDAISFSAVFVWCGFQTGNFAQLALALGRLWEVRPDGTRDQTFHMPDQQALCSLLTFNLGAFLLGRLGDQIGSKKRVWLVFGTLVQALMTMAAALCLWKSGQGSIASDRGDPSWNNTLTFIVLGVQGIMGKRINSQFGTTIVLTTIWYHRLIAAATLFLGAFPGALGVGTGIRVLMALSWAFVPGKE
ncbi:hypothetical protein DL96DRAFT_1612495 [Flagelloscypha sp. PMI_526]|nr:hypothetical protein DL96DRAFT_1612495 [Flagelloscypha sp. PMI_526]